MKPAWIAVSTALMLAALSAVAFAYWLTPSMLLALLSGLAFCG
jgi:hypothetical protein